MMESHNRNYCFFTDEKKIQIWHEPGINNLKLILNKEQE
ncbi:Uncharacterised protein [Klebsiella pneumoniae]|uniref:Uncharacterized protein n=2 Tax=Klebsiella pneumoniae TaxID=573 RepID=A0A377TFP2_KLEPN|nr:Uncharacterised protein [Klebsiella pneumoniae]